MFDNINYKEQIDKIWENKVLLKNKENQDIIAKVIESLDKGEIRAAEKKDGKWQTNEWVKKAILLYFEIQPLSVIENEPFYFYDKIPLKKNYDKLEVRVVPHAIARYGSYIAPGVILMPSYVNIGAYIDSGTMIDTWATIGSCAQIGKNVHISGGVGIGGVLEPLQANPVIIEDGCFIGSRCIIVEGAIIGEQAVLGANVVITASTHIIDVTESKPKEYKGFVPPYSVVIPGSYSKKFKAGTYYVQCALIIGKRNKNTDLKISLNETLRKFKLSV
ncbi:MAG: 2,3,4,5-tetrahydropyridine-2,6-dicarboxylate N-succinyltransferase [Bacteroidales bacterium]|nr:2,3,4,5-tetrahydropyridine-2,6-dicarboxylate N-succinyltransferase [Bacteroidales bacterium]